MNPKSLPLLLFALFLLASSLAVGVAPAAADSPPARFGHSMVNVNGNVYVFGGLVPGNPNPKNDLWMYQSGATDLAEILALGPPAGRHSHAATAVDGKMYISGGMDGEGNTLDDSWKYYPATNDWSQVLAAGPPPARSGHSLNTLPDGRMVVAGGIGSLGSPLVDVWILDTVASSWTEGAEFTGPPGALYGASTAVHGGKVYVSGSTDDVYVYDVITDRWGTITPGGTTPPNRVLGASAQVGSSTVEYLFGGEDENGNILSDIWEFDYDSNTWTRKTDMPVALCRSAAATFESQSQSQHVLIFGGLQSNGKPTNRTFVYIPEAEECVPGIEVNKTVFKETAGEWVDAITAELNETVRFRCVVHNNGTCCDLTDITVTDILSDSLEYRDNATVDGVAAEPTAVSENEYKWEFAGPLAPCEAITIEFDARVIECGKDRNRQNASAWCEEIGAWVSDEDTVWVNCTEVPPVCVETATGSGIACFETDAGTILDLVAVDEATLPAEGKPALVFPHGFFSFNITGLTAGQTVEVTITLPDNVPVGTQYWKYHASEGGWIQIPMGSDDGDAMITITLVDGGLGDDDGTANGVIVDQGGPGIPGAPPNITSFAPPSPVNDTVCNWRTFNVTVDQTVDVDWYLNDALQQTNESVQEASCRLHADSAGAHNVTAIASNANGNDMQTWIWNVRKAADLVITAKWLCWPDNCTICYNVTNIGDGTAPACHNTTLYVDGVAVAYDHVPVDLAPGESYIGCFKGYVWPYTPPSDNITVCADNDETLVELDETNNCLTNIWMCGDVNGDSKVTMSDVRKVFNRYLDPSYPLDLPWAADVNCDGKVTMSDVRKVFNRYLDPGYELNCCCIGQ